MPTQSIANMAAVAASIASDYDRLMFCRTYARTHSPDETKEFMRLTAELLPHRGGRRPPLSRRTKNTPLS